MPSTSGSERSRNCGKAEGGSRVWRARVWHGEEECARWSQWCWWCCNGGGTCVDMRLGRQSREARKGGGEEGGRGMGRLAC